MNFYGKLVHLNHASESHYSAAGSQRLELSKYSRYNFKLFIFFVLVILIEVKIAVI